MEKMRIYIAGRITGNEHWKSEFLNAEIKLRDRYPDALIVNPLYLGSDQKTWKENMVECIRMLVTCDTICLLRGWNKSKGATIEASLSIGLGLEVITEREVM